MTFYFLLQFKMLNRRLADFGLPPMIAYFLFPIAFVVLSNHLFSKIEFATYIYTTIAMGLSLKLSDRKRNTFLKSSFNNKDYLKLRMLENITLSLPFIGFLIYKQEFIPVMVNVIIAIALTFVNFNIGFNHTIPTPFHKRPFEFAVGFRKTYFIFPIAYVLMAIAIYVANFNLGIASMLLVFLVSISYYSKLENEYYIWNYNLTAQAFLSRKIKTGIYNVSLLSIPIVIPLSFYFYDHFLLLALFFLLGQIYLIAVILAKYSSYPNAMHLPQGILIALSFVFPPILVAILPYFYFQSTKNLNSILK